MYPFSPRSRQYIFLVLQLSFTIEYALPTVELSYVLSCQTPPLDVNPPVGIPLLWRQPEEGGILLIITTTPSREEREGRAIPVTLRQRSAMGRPYLLSATSTHRGGIPIIMTSTYIGCIIHRCLSPTSLITSHLTHLAGGR